MCLFSNKTRVQAITEEKTFANKWLNETKIAQLPMRKTKRRWLVEHGTGGHEEMRKNHWYAQIVSKRYCNEWQNVLRNTLVFWLKSCFPIDDWIKYISLK